MTRLKRLIVEVHRRSLWQVLGIYVVASWVGYQVVLGLADGVGLPDWVPAFAIVLFVIGLPIVLATAFVQEGGPLSRRVDAAPLAEPLDPTLFGDHPVEDAEYRARNTYAGARHHLLFTWQRALLGGIVAFLLLGITAGGYIGMRNAGVGPFGSLVTSGRLDAHASLIVADFTATNADSVLTMAVAQAFRSGLAQSDALQVVNPTQVRAALQRMGRTETQLDVTLAREVAERDGMQAIVVGDVTQAGGRYTLSVSLIAPDGAQLMAAVTENAATEADVLDAVDRLAKRVRERIGESFRSLRQSAPLSAVTTHSLDALRRYTLGARAYDLERNVELSIALLEEAVAMDSTFAMAWRKLGAVYNAAGADRARVIHAVTKAYDNRDRLTEAERYQAIAFYHMNVTQDRRKALAAYQSLLEISPRDASLNNIGNLYSALGDPEAALEAYQRAIAADSTQTTPYYNIVRTYAQLGRWDEAVEHVDLYARRFGDGPAVVDLRGSLASARGDYATAERSAEQLIALRGRSPTAYGYGIYQLEQLHAIQGKLASATRLQAQNAEFHRERGNEGNATAAEVFAAARHVVVAGDATGALRMLDGLTDRLANVDPVDRPYHILAQVYAQAGEVQRARQLADQLEKEIPAEELGDRRKGLLIARADIALHEQRYEDALRDLHTADAMPGGCRACAGYWIAKTHDRAGRADSAAIYFQRYLDLTDIDRIDWDGFFLGPTLERLSELYLTLGRNEQAKLTAARFVQLWENADAQLQPRVQAKKEMLARLQEKR